MSWQKCPVCGGTGKNVNQEKCVTCQGFGIIDELTGRPPQNTYENFSKSNLNSSNPLEKYEESKKFLDM